MTTRIHRLLRLAPGPGDAAAGARRRRIGRTARRRVAAVLPMVMAAGVLGLISPTAAHAGEPSVPLPTTASTPVTQQTMGARDADQASTSALHGDQPAQTGILDGGGTDHATPLSPSATWDVSAQTGDFSWSYPLKVPPSAGGLDPDLALTYASSSVDGRTSATNNQASWIGDGWDLSAGFVERTYIPCSADAHPVQTGDLCWRSDNAVASYAGGGGELVRDDTTGLWRERQDDGSTIERLTGAGNTDNDGEYWRITTIDGTQYYFGDRADAGSTWTVPVYGNDADEPCHAATFTASACTQTWRWNLDKVVDTHGNVILYDYTPETNSYGADGKDAAVPYVRGGTLKDVLYGVRGSGPPSDRVLFTTADRCVPGSDCTPAKTGNWPDVPWDDQCAAATCPGKNAPTFWSTRRLDTVTTQALSGGVWHDVDSWKLNQEFPTTGDGEKPALWLKSVTRTGLAAGTAVTLPPVTFEGTKFANRVDQADGLGPLLRYRLTGVVSESGGAITVTYAPPDCTATSVPTDPATNTRRCFPMTWAKKDFSERTDYFNKYVVAQVTQSDMIAANTEDVTAYQYLDGAAWAYDTSEFTKDADRTWNDFRGFGRVRIVHGKPDDPSGPQTMTEERFYRGLDGDKGRTGTQTVTDSEGGVRTDDLWLRGTEFESQTHDGTGESVVTKQITTPTVQGPTATRGTVKAYIVRPGTVTDYTTLAAGGRRVTLTATAYDDRGEPVSVDDQGDVATPADDLCTRTSYARNPGLGIYSLPAETDTVSATCAAVPDYPGDAVSGARYAYDGQDFGAAPTKGDATTTQTLTAHPSAGPVWTTSATTGYDTLGRTVSAADALGRTTTTAYTPADGGPATATAVTNAAHQTATTTLDPLRGMPVKTVDANGLTTETAYDALGEVTGVWKPNRKRATDPASESFTYSFHNTAPTTVTADTLGPRGDYSSAVSIYDGLLRLRQVQQPAADGGRLITDTTYDSQGRASRTTKPYFNDAAVDDKLWIASDVDVPQQTVTRYDGAGRDIADIVKGAADELWRTTTSYGGDRVTVTPPAGATPTTTVTDARGRTVELDQYHGATPAGAHDTTTYTYTPAGQLASTTGPDGSTWHREYDLQGRETRSQDVDAGTSTMAYDAAGQLLSTTDGRGTTLAYAYDALGRRTEERIGSATGPLQAAWTYDTAIAGKGHPASSTRYAGGQAYTSQVLSYNGLGLPTATRTTIPDREGALGGTYTTYRSYAPDGSPSGVTYPAIGGLPEETVTQSYDDLGEPQTLYGGIDGTTTDYVGATSYTRYGEVARLQLGDEGARVWLSTYYDDHTRRATRTITDAELPVPMLSDTHYTYDPAGDVTSIADTPKGKPADIQCFRTDYLQRLTDAWTPSAYCASDPTTADLAGPAPYWQSFTYDPAGDRTSTTDHTAAGDTVTTSALPDHAHTLTSTATMTPDGTATTTGYTYDRAGNTLTRGDQSLTWDTEGRLASVTQGPASTDFLYDPDGTRLVRHDPTGATLYLDGQELRFDKATGTLSGSRYYTSGGTTVAVREPAGLTWLASDLQNTEQIAVSSTDLRVIQRRQTPFGAPRGPQPAFPGSKSFVGGTADPSTGLTELGARQYAPDLGRFLSVDPVLDTSDPQQMEGYAYADNSPVTKTDPSGQLWGWLQDTFDAVGEAAQSVGHTVASAASSVAQFVDENRVGLGMLATLGMLLIPGVGIGVALGIVAAGLTTLDMWHLTNTRRADQAMGLDTSKEDAEFTADAIGLALGDVGAAAGSAAAGLEKSMGPVTAARRAAIADSAVVSGSAVVDTYTLVNGIAVTATREGGWVQLAAAGYDSCYRPYIGAPVGCGPLAAPAAAPAQPKKYRMSGPFLSSVPRTYASPLIPHVNYRFGPTPPPPTMPGSFFGRIQAGTARSKKAGYYQDVDGYYHNNKGGLPFY